MAAMEEVYDVSSSAVAKEEIVAAVITMLPDGAGSDAEVVGVMRMLGKVAKSRDGLGAQPAFHLFCLLPTHKRLDKE